MALIAKARAPGFFAPQTSLLNDVMGRHLSRALTRAGSLHFVQDDK